MVEISSRRIAASQRVKMENGTARFQKYTPMPDFYSLTGKQIRPCGEGFKRASSQRCQEAISPAPCKNDPHFQGALEWR